MQALRDILGADRRQLRRCARRMARVARQRAGSRPSQRLALQRELGTLANCPALQRDSLQHCLLSHLRARHPVAAQLVEALQHDRARLLERIELARHVVAAPSVDGLESHQIEQIGTDLERRIERLVNAERRLLSPLIELLISNDQLEQLLWLFFENSRPGVASGQAIELVVLQSRSAWLH